MGHMFYIGLHKGKHDKFFWSETTRIKALSTALAKHHANGDTSMVTEIVNLCPIM